MRSLTDKRVLIVDDNVDLADNLREILEDEGLSVSVANAGPEALAQLSGQEFDLVLTDMRMPGLSGLEVLRRVRREFPAVPVAVMTAYSSDAVLEEARVHGAIGVLLKPVPLPQLLDLVQLALEPNQTVLLVEDEPALRVDLTEVLGSGRALTFACANLSEARRCLDAIVPDVAVIDRRLPDGDGLELATGLSTPATEAGRHTRVPILMITGAEVESIEIEGLRAVGPVDCLQKPFALDTLLQRLERLTCSKS